MTTKDTGGSARDLLLPNALEPVPVVVPADDFDNTIRKWGVGFCCEWFGQGYDSEFSHWTVRILQERAARKEES